MNMPLELPTLSTMSRHRQGGNAGIAAPPVASVVIPAYNEAVALPRTLDAVLRSIDRTRERIELIVVDNASTDRTAEIATSYGATLLTEPAKGVSHARNAGLNAARSDIILSTDADTVVPGSWIERHMEEYADADVVGVCGGVEIDRVHPLYSALQNGRRLLAMIARQVRPRRHPAIHPPHLSGGNSSFRRAAAVAVGGYEPGVNYGEDHLLARKLYRQGKIVRAMDPAITVLTSGRRFQHVQPLLRQACRKTLSVLGEKLTGRWIIHDFDDVR